MRKIKYVPILKLRDGEIKALKNLTETQAKAIIPVFEIVDLDENISDMLEKLIITGLSEVYVDTSVIDDDDKNILIELLKLSSGKEFLIYPVLYFDDLPSVANETLKHTKRLLYKIFVPDDEVYGPVYSDIFRELFSWISGKDISVDIMFDLGEIRNAQQASIQLKELRNVVSKYIKNNKSKFDRIIVSSTSFPRDLSSLAAGESMKVDRHDINLFKAIYKDHGFLDIKDLLIYSDYGVTKFTDSEIDFSQLKYGPLPKGKYTTKDKYWIIKGKKNRITKQWIKNYYDIAREIFNSNDYYGENFSFGDLDIKRKAFKETGPGNHTSWVIIAANHHIAVLVDELSTIYDS